MRTQIIPIEYPTATLELPTPLPTISTPESTGTSGQTLLAQFPCIPNQTPETGRVLDVVDGNTIKVLIKELMYVVRYIGVNVPMDGDIKEPFGKTATHFNAQLVYGKDIILVKDVNNKDDRGRLLRYVIVGNTLVNFELIRAGYGVAKDTPPDSACVDTFTRAEQEARQALVGQWSGTPMP
jgi:micrococcal nuclease